MHLCALAVVLFVFQYHLKQLHINIVSLFFFLGGGIGGGEDVVGRWRVRDPTDAKAAGYIQSLCQAPSVTGRQPQERALWWGHSEQCFTDSGSRTERLIFREKNNAEMDFLLSLKKRVQKNARYVSNAGASALCVFFCSQLFHCRAVVSTLRRAVMCLQLPL